MRKQWGKVESYARKWLEQEPHDVYAIQSIGEALEKQGHIDEALQYYERALEADRQENREIGHSFFLKRLDILYHRAGRYEACFRVCRYYTRRHSSSWDAWNRLRRAAQKTGNPELSTAAKERADEIKAQREAEKRAREARYQQWKIMYEQKLKEIGVKLGSQPSDLREEPHPSLEASDEEWGMWIQRTTDFEKREAEIQAGLYATVELERKEREEELDPPRKMTEMEREQIIHDELGKLKSGQNDIVIFSDRKRPDNYVQFAGGVCEVSSRAFPASKLPPLNESQVEALLAMGFKQPNAPEQLSNCFINYKNLSIEQAAKLVGAAFKILGSPQNFEIVVGS